MRCQRRAHRPRRDPDQIILLLIPSSPLIVLSSRFSWAGNEDRCIRSRARIRLKEIAQLLFETKKY